METNSTAPETGPVPNDANGDSAASGQPAEGAAGSAPSSGAPGAATPALGTGIGFYGWLGRLGIPRRAGWLGGVCAGIGARLGIDPIIVRGIVVVVAVLGAPFVLLYAIAWLLLPDVDGEIHLERLTRGIVDPAIVGIAVMGVIGFIPLVQGGWLGWRWWPDWTGLWVGGIDLLAPLRVLWVLTVIAAITALVIWLVRRASQNPPDGGTASRMASADAAAVPGTSRGAGERADAAAPVGAAIVAFTAADAPVAPDTSSAAPTGAAGATAAASVADLSVEPLVPAEGADAAALAEWRSQHEAWRRSNAEWKQGQEQAERTARAQAIAENKAKAQVLAAQADTARAARRASRPRASAAYVFMVFGLALVAAAIAAIWALGSPWLKIYAVGIPLAVATLVLAAGMCIAALRRRRSGMLAFAASITTVFMLANTMAPGATWLPPSTGQALSQSGSIVQPLGNAQFYPAHGFIPGSPHVEIAQGIGDVQLQVVGDERVLLDASDAGTVLVTRYDADGKVIANETPRMLAPSAFGGAPGTSADAELVVRQWIGTVHVSIYETD